MSTFKLPTFSDEKSKEAYYEMMFGKQFMESSNKGRLEELEEININK